MLKMVWYAGKGRYTFDDTGHYFTRLEDGTEIEVHPDVYQQRFQDYLLRICVRHTTFAEIMRKAEQEWKAFCAVRDTFDENIEQWREETQTPGVSIRYPVPPYDNREEPPGRE